MGWVALGILALLVGMAAAPAGTVLAQRSAAPSASCGAPAVGLAAAVPAVQFVQAEATPTPVPNTASVSDDRVNAVARQMYCPVCENIPLDVCPTQACAEWRELIRQKLALGWSTQQIRQYFAEQYGPRVLDTPPAQGFYALIYILPYVALLLGVYVLVRVFVSMKRSRPAAAQAAGQAVESAQKETADPYLQQMEEELKKRG
jgi:cytochrome c-type biogenesis protein CcmH